MKRALECWMGSRDKGEGGIDMDSWSDLDGKMVGGSSPYKGLISMDGSLNNSLSTCEHKIQRIQVLDAGQPIVNRRYHLYLQTYHHWLKRPIYFHFEGPFVIQNEYYDVCIFQKWGYGLVLRAVDATTRKNSNKSTAENIIECN